MAYKIQYTTLGLPVYLSGMRKPSLENYMYKSCYVSLCRTLPSFNVVANILYFPFPKIIHFLIFPKIPFNILCISH